MWLAHMIWVRLSLVVMWLAHAELVRLSFSNFASISERARDFFACAQKYEAKNSNKKTTATRKRRETVHCFGDAHAPRLDKLRERQSMQPRLHQSKVVLLSETSRRNTWCLFVCCGTLKGTALLRFD